jgi:hypothetical protein
VGLVKSAQGKTDSTVQGIGNYDVLAFTNNISADINWLYGANQPIQVEKNSNHGYKPVLTGPKILKPCIESKVFKKGKNQEAHLCFIFTESWLSF